MSAQPHPGRLRPWFWQLLGSDSPPEWLLRVRVASLKKPSISAAAGV